MMSYKRVLKSIQRALFAAPLWLLTLAVLMRSPPAVFGRPANHSYIGCYLDSGTVGARDLNALYRVLYFGGYSMVEEHATAYNWTTMTLEQCSTICSLGGFKYFGVQFTCCCFCSNSYGRYGPAASESQCNTTCAGNHSQMCGGWGRNSVYALTYEKSSKCIGFVQAPRNYIAITAATPYTSPLYQTAYVLSSLECTARCQAGQCEAVLFVEQQRAWHLLRYPLIPYPDLYSTAGEFFVRA